MLTCNFDNSFAQQLLPHSLGRACQPEQVSEPRLVYLNQTLAHDLGLLSKQSADQQRELIAEYLSGNRLIDGASPIAVTEAPTSLRARTNSRWLRGKAGSTKTTCIVPAG